MLQVIHCNIIEIYLEGNIIFNTNPLLIFKVVKTTLFLS